MKRWSDGNLPVITPVISPSSDWRDVLWVLLGGVFFQVFLWYFWASFRLTIVIKTKKNPKKNRKTIFKQHFITRALRKKGLACFLYSHILSSVLTWCVSQQPLKCTCLTPSLHFKAPHHGFLPPHGSNLTKCTSVYDDTATSFLLFIIFLLSPDPEVYKYPFVLCMFSE